MQTTKGPVRLNLGAGPAPLPGYLNLDRKAGGEAYPLRCPPAAPFDPETPGFLGIPDGVADEVRASHVLEHFSHRETIDVLREWARVLKPGGVLKVAVPDFGWCVEQAAKGNPGGYPLEGYIMGGHVDADDHHGAMFNRTKLEELLTAAGFTDIQPWKSEIQDCAALPVSLNLMGTKPGAAAIPSPPSPGPDAKFRGCARNVYSQNGEDGILEEIFRRIGTTNKHCFEVGAGDGILFSNTRKLIEEGWQSVQIEADPKRYARLEENCRAFGLSHGLWLWNRAVRPDGPNSLDNILRASNAPQRPDLGVIDIDGQDYFVWLAMDWCRPRVMVVEYSPEHPDDYIPPRGYDGPEYRQAGVEPIAYVGASKGYACIARTATNLIFVERESLDRVLDGFPIQPPEPAVQQVAPAPPAPSTSPNAAAERRTPFLPDVHAVLSMPRYAFTQQVVSLLELVTRLRVPVRISQGAFWNQVLTVAMEEAIDAGAKYILTIDIDTIFKAEHVAELYRLMEATPEAAAVVSMQIGRDRDHVLMTKRDDGNPGRNVGEIDADLIDNHDLLRINTGHFGLTLIRAESLKTLPRPWFLGVPDPTGSWKANRVDPDIYFWRQCEKAGLGVYQANKVRVGHWQDVISLIGNDLDPVHVYAPDFRNGKLPEGVTW